MIGGPVARHTLTVRRAPLVEDDRGNQERDWANAEETPIPGWALDAGNTSQDLQNRDGSSVEYTARGPFNADVQGSDRVLYAGDVYEITGGVRRQPGPSALTSHSILLLTRWNG